MYSAELYPTVVRSAGVGSSSLFARVGGAVAPYIGALDVVVSPTLPVVIFGFTALAAGAAATMLPETQKRYIVLHLTSGAKTLYGKPLPLARCVCATMGEEQHVV